MKHLHKLLTSILLAGLVHVPLLALAESGSWPGWPIPVYESGEQASGPKAESLPAEASLTDYLTYAAVHNPGLEASFNQWKAAMENVDQMDVLPNPKLTFGYFIEEVETRVGPQEAKVGISQVFPWFGTLDLRGDVEAQAAKVAFEQYQGRKFDLFYEVKQAYYEYYYLHQIIDITADNIELMKHLEGVALSKFKTGGHQTGLIKAQVELGKLEDRFHTLKDLRGPMAARLNAALNRPYDDVLPWPDQAPLAGASIRSDDLFAQLLTGNPALKALDASIEKEEQAIALARKGYYPGFMVGVDYVFTDEALMAGAPDSGKDPLIAMIALDLPIWRGKYRSEVEEATLRRDAAELTRAHKENQLEAKLRMAVFRFRDAERKINLYGSSLIPQAEQSLNVTEEAYRSGSADFLSLIDADRLLLEFQLSHERALADREIGLAEIEMLVGRPLTQSLTP